MTGSSIDIALVTVLIDPSRVISADVVEDFTEVDRLLSLEFVGVTLLLARWQQPKSWFRASRMFFILYA